jgi:hypothetical protein
MKEGLDERRVGNDERLARISTRRELVLIITLTWT